MKKITRIVVLATILAGICLPGFSKEKKISYDELRDRIAGAWIGQMAGNIYGLEYENDFIMEPGPDGPFTFERALRDMKEVDGAFSDDDTDIEYIYLTMMEKYGVKPTYEQMREGWMYHIRDRVWLANRASLGLMHYGLTPPFTGDRNINPHWFQIDPQLINEIWSYTAPGMMKYAAGISDWAARITSDSWAASPTIVYGVMYANAFFESDIRTLVENALEYLPEDDRYAGTVRDCLALYDLYPDDWRAARQAIAEKYYVNEPSMTKTIWNANLNGAMGILTFLYGGGDFEKTLNIGCAMGFDADNQTATVCGLLGVMYGQDIVPASLSRPFAHWTKPFNDRYINVTRYDMPDASIEDMIDRTLDLAVKVVESQGGKTVEKNGRKYLVINTDAEYRYPMEFCVGPAPRIIAGEPVDYDFRSVTNRGYEWSIAAGTLPDGLEFRNGRITGIATVPGHYPLTLSLSDGKDSIGKDFDIIVRGRNLAKEGGKIIASADKCNFQVLDSCWLTNSRSYYAADVDVINDGKVNGEGSVFCSLTEKSDRPKDDWFGYVWDEPQTIGMMSFHYGCIEEFGGWYSDMWVEALDDDGQWRKINAEVIPSLPESDEVFFQPHFVEYLFEFAPVTTRGIRIKGHDKVEHHWHKYTKNVSSFICVSEVQAYAAEAKQVRMSKAELMDRIKGGWAGQTIGVVYGAPTEFKFTGTTIQDYQPIPWSEGYVRYWWDKKPGLFDDIYNDLTFVEAFQEMGLDCSADSLAMRFAFADYHLAHANQAGRYNIRQGIMPPMSGHWTNNPHADDLDFQIEADFIGLMAPGMMPQAMDIASRVGHIMNSGDGFYGGAFVAGLYAAAFLTDDPAEILDMALENIPQESTFWQCVNDVRVLHAKYPDDWKQCWFEMHKKWNIDRGCPKGVFLSFNIDAKINSAYVAMGLLYGGGDFSRSVEIAARCGQDSDCNPATVGGVLGTVLGYDGIPEFWLGPLEEIWDLDFQGTDISLAKGSGYSYAQALELIRRAGGEVTEDSVSIPLRKAFVLPYEENFTDTYPLYRDRKDCWMDSEYEFSFKGNGFVIWGNLVCLRHITPDYADRVSTRHIGSEVFALAEPDDPYVAEIEVWIDGRLDHVSVMPMKNTARKLEPAWKYLLPEGGHTVKLVWRNPSDEYLLRINDIMYYSDHQNTDRFYHN